jgi:hypothetical protein
MKEQNSFWSTSVQILKAGALMLNEHCFDTRISTCGSCVEHRRISKMTICQICGCNMNIKARFAASKCPLDKWDKPPP